MKLDAQDCALYAQVLPVFMLGIAVIEMYRGPNAKWNPMWFLVLPLLLASSAEGWALQGAIGDGLGPIRGAFVVWSTLATIWVVAGVGAVVLWERGRPLE